jgi:hypothetical protein
MKPAWDKLMKEYEGHASALVADVDCTAAGKPLCDSNGVQGFPTIKYGTAADMEKYSGGRDFAAMKKFADENLKPRCSPKNLDLCDEKQKKEIQDLEALGADELKKRIDEESKKMDDANTKFKDEVAQLQKRYEALQKEKDATLAAIKDSGLGLMKSVAAAMA